MEQMDLLRGKELRDEAIKRAMTHADDVEEEWSQKAFQLLLEFRKTKNEFMTEDLRLWAHDTMGLKHPPDERAWGGVINRAVKGGLLVRIGYAPMKSPNCHANPKAVWRSVKWV